ncbi:hypothetical protein BH11PSE13_BH11PSE13_07310 [soil metagenome]
MQHPTLFEYLRRQQDVRRLRRYLVATDFAYWLSAAALYLSVELNHQDLTVSAMVLFAMLSAWLTLLVGKAVRFTGQRAAMVWMLATLLLGPFGALFIPAIQLGRLNGDFS